MKIRVDARFGEPEQPKYVDKTRSERRETCHELLAQYWNYYYIFFRSERKEWK